MPWVEKGWRQPTVNYWALKKRGRLRCTPLCLTRRQHIDQWGWILISCSAYLLVVIWLANALFSSSFPRHDELFKFISFAPVAQPPSLQSLLLSPAGLFNDKWIFLLYKIALAARQAFLGRNSTASTTQQGQCQPDRADVICFPATTARSR